MRRLTSAGHVTPSATAALGQPRTSVIPAQGKAFFSIQLACRTAQRDTTPMRTATSVSPATVLAGRVKGDTACSASPADQAGSSWEKSAYSSAGKDTTEKTPLASVRGATRTAGLVRAHGPQTACPAIRFSFCCAPRESVTAPAQSTTMQNKARRPVRDATRLVMHAKEKEHQVAYPVCGITISWEESAIQTVLLGNTEWERERNLPVQSVTRAAWNARDLASRTAPCALPTCF